MFIVTDANTAAIRDLFEKEGELSAAIELRRRLPDITDNAKARECTRATGNRKPPSMPAPKVTWLCPRKR